MPLSERPWREWYSSKGWRRIRRFQLIKEPMCCFCAQRGLAVPATIVDHIQSHGGDWNAFWLGPLQSLCEHCHNSRKAVVDHRGYDTTIGPDGWPCDPQHPANSGKLRPTRSEAKPPDPTKLIG